MKSSTGSWVVGENFFGRDIELEILESRVRDRNHVLLTGQRRMGKTSLARELGRRLESQGWACLFTNVEGADCPEDVVARIAEAIHPVRPLLRRVVTKRRRLLGRRLQELTASAFGLKFRALLSDGNWRQEGEALFRECAAHDQPVLLFIDELPIFLNRLLATTGGAQQAEIFLSWLRSMVQSLGDESPVLIVSGSIGLAPLVRRLGIPDRINHLHPMLLGPWDRDTSVECFNLLAQSHQLQIEEGVGNAVYDALGRGIPHHVQCFFARLHDFSRKNLRDELKVQDVDEVYRTELLGASGQNDLVHYETRLKQALDDPGHTIAMEILAEAATQNGFGPNARRSLQILYSRLIEDAPDRISQALDMLVHDGYLEIRDEDASPMYRFPSHLLKDWWSARYQGHHTPLADRTDVRGERSSP